MLYKLLKTAFNINLAGLILLAQLSCQSSSNEPVSISPYEISQVIGQVTEVMVHDVTNPPLAARFFAYISLSGLVALNDSTTNILLSKINDYPVISVENTSYPHIHPQISAVLAMLHTASSIQPSGFQHAEHIEIFKAKHIDLGFSPQTILDSENYAISISKEILTFALSDKYNQTSNLPRYTPIKTEGSWYPTPPGYFPPVEPYFHTIRPFFLDSASQFAPIPPIAFSDQRDSEFLKLAEEVYSQDLTEEKKIIASFWDCNPFALEDRGHLMIGLKKISPGAHWMGIANIACKDAKLEFNKVMEINTILAITLQDAFMACWDEKYRSNRIRPETAIRKHIDPKYVPLLQTPPFPEYLSGHSVASTASAVILTNYFGDGFAYTDTVEMKYGLPARSFSSFTQAAEEAAISRFYGGIHYMDGIVEGQKQGNLVGKKILEKIFYTESSSM
ncbi:vanadium-dependent haloperoxidase [Belliella sp. DSM 111904]|uniref:Vanadium-dependent haloperoxidase n=1 Tax=Belliella filtrata TaxID=2923435 RepID=A0ABS9UV46_9BACT|nr:vanadium-dependent haloperoxidase [Belliella filtrata]MCH7407944.1 vanadium-dependent haloperoxidase [Belliella filtrata]